MDIFVLTFKVLGFYELFFETFNRVHIIFNKVFLELRARYIRPRYVFSKEQKEELETMYRNEKYPKNYPELAAKMGLEKMRVVVSFYLGVSP